MKILAVLTITLSFPCFAADHKFDIMDSAGKLVGEGSYKDSKKGVKLNFKLKGAQPGAHAMHIHDKGICQGPKFETAGGHLNPTMKKHGHQAQDGSHLGDLGNVEVPANGNVKKEIVIKELNLKPGSESSLMTANGTSLVIHAKADDEKTDPSGASGDRIYCGVLSEAIATASAQPTTEAEPKR